MLPGAALALGLGDIRLNSALNAPLDAEIQLVNALPEDLSTLEAKIASRDTFARYSLDWPAFLNSVTITKDRSVDGRDVLRLRSSETITEPFLTVLVEASWARGRLVREYTVLLDPPVFAPGNQPAAPVSAAATGAATGTIDRPAERPATRPVAQTSPAAAGVATGESGDGYRVRRGDSLSAIARRLAPAASVSTEQMMLGLYQSNSSAFEGDMNRLRSAVTLTVPSADELAAISPTVASAEVRRQAGFWNRSAESGSGRLRLVTPSDSGVGAGSGASAGDSQALANRIGELESKLAETQRLLELRNAELADLQAKLGGTPTPAEPAATVEPPVATTEPQPEPTAEGESATPEASMTETPAEPGELPAGEPPVASTETPAGPPVTTEPPVATSPVQTAPEPSLFDRLKDFWFVLPILLLGLLGLFGYRKLKSRKTESFDDQLGELAQRNAENLTQDFPPLEVRPNLRKQRDAERIEVEESGSHRQIDLPADDDDGLPVRSSDDTISSDTAINLDQGDPIAEADFHMAYGLYDQAADLVKIAISREPERRDLKLKLLEVFFVWGNKDQFLTSARELTATRAAGPAGEWEKILIMGKQIAPEDELFSGAAAGATGAVDVDLNLEGGAGHVDFDPFDGAASGPGESVDLDFGGALQDPEATGEADAEAAKTGGLDFALPDDTAPGSGDDKSGATTRQMTARMSGGAPAGVLESSDAPTVEQPALQGDNPTIRQKVELALKRKAPIDQTAELAIDDLGLDLGALEGTDAPGLDGPLDSELGDDTADANAPTMVAGLDDRSRNMMQQAADRAAKQQAATGAQGASGTWYLSESDMGGDIDPSKTMQRTQQIETNFDEDAAHLANTSQLDGVDSSKVDFELTRTGVHANNGLDLDVGTPAKSTTMKTEQLKPEDLALPDLEPVTLSEVGTKLDLARAYVDMGDPDGARNILEEVLTEGSVSQKQEAQRLLDSLPG
ncbi:MAG: hypothetical protein KDI32_06760 [Pseudomonadales bacterium]|nr:hypothetical protein [Pseudomonadales bacterium]